MTQKCPILSKRFDLDDIRALREYNSLRHAEMSAEEMFADIEKDASKMRRAIACYREMNRILAEDEDEEKDPNFPVLSPRFDLEDIRKLREYDSLRHWNMTDEEIEADIDKDADKMQRAVECMREVNRIFADDDDTDDDTITSESAAVPEPALEEQAV